MSNRPAASKEAQSEEEILYKSIDCASGMISGPTHLDGSEPLAVPAFRGFAAAAVSKIDTIFFELRAAGRVC